MFSFQRKLHKIGKNTGKYDHTQGTQLSTETFCETQVLDTLDKDDMLQELQKPRVSQQPQ